MTKSVKSILLGVLIVCFISNTLQTIPRRCVAPTKEVAGLDEEPGKCYYIFLAEEPMPYEEATKFCRSMIPSDGRPIPMDIVQPKTREELKVNNRICSRKFKSVVALNNCNQ